MTKRKSWIGWVIGILVIVGLISGFYGTRHPTNSVNSVNVSSLHVKNLPQYSGKASIVLNHNQPSFTKKDLVTTNYQHFSDLDKLGRCGSAEACLSYQSMPTAERGDISEVHPSGWQVGTNNIYNRGHLIGYQLSGQNANEKNLVTMTRQCNVEAMLPYENQLADYLRSSRNHVLYRVTPIFQDNELVCRGVLMEAESVEDGGKGVKFCIYCYNNQNGYTIDYSTGRLYHEGSTTPIGRPYVQGNQWSKGETRTKAISSQVSQYVVNKRSHVFHKPSCDAVQQMSPSNKALVKVSRDSLVQQGYHPCPRCDP